MVIHTTPRPRPMYFRAPESLHQRLKAVLRSGESINAFGIAAIEAAVSAREAEAGRAGGDRWSV